MFKRLTICQLLLLSSVAHADLRQKARPVEAPPAEGLKFTVQAAQKDTAETLALVCQFALGASHNAAFGAGLVAPDYFTGEALNLTTYLLNLSLKACPPSLILPKDIEYAPPAGQCHQDVRRDATRGRAANVLGTQLSVQPDSGKWLDNSRPVVFAWNTDVVVTRSLAGNGVEDLGDNTLRLSTGIHQENYRAENYASFWDYLYVPGLPLPKGAEKILGKSGAKFAEFALNVGINAGLITASLTLDGFTFADTPTGSINQQQREIAVLDSVPPEATIFQDTYTVEALELGGASILGVTPTGQSNGELLRSGFTVEDDCAPETELAGPFPEFWPIGQTTRVVWTARDDGPNEQRERNRTDIVQYVNVVDTLPPTVLAPPSKVVEADGDTAMVELGQARVFDFGDADPTLEVDGQVPPQQAEFALGRHELEWRATDDFGNTDVDVQRITVKQAGTNLTPTAESRRASARTFLPQEIIIEGNDPDTDPLDFRIESFPPNGGFEAPLLPYFIEDFRGNYEARSTCDANRPWSELANPDHVLITDEGLSYVVDCHGGESRIVVFDEDRNVLAGLALERNSSLNNGIYFVPGQNIILYTGQNGPAGVRLYLLEPETLEIIRRYRHESPPSRYSGLSSFLINEHDLMFLPDGLGNVRVLDLWESEQDPDDGDWIFPEPIAMFEIDPGETAGGGFSVARDMVLNHDNEIIFVTEGRVHKMSPSVRDADGTPIIGEMVGWIGACTSGEGCDPLRQASRGFSCRTGVTCQTGEALYYGSGNGQFSQSQSASIDRRNNIYVADWGNGRIQRFTDDGVFGGEAVSVCPPEQRCFLLGDFGRPDSVAVNSRNLYVFDKTTDVIHVFETSVIEPIDDRRARVVYTANDGFTGTDRFTFSATDGLARSAPATVSIDVTRQFRPPSADRIELTGQEDIPLPIRLSGTDPDGAVDLPLTYQVLEGPDVGTLTGTAPELVFQGPQHWYGETSFTFRVSDGRDWSEPETVTLTLEPVNDPPVLELQSVSMDNPDTTPIEITAGFPATFTFRYTDVDDVDLHRFDVDWNAGSGFRNLETDVVTPTVDNNSPLLVASQNEGEIVATRTFTNDFETETVRACVSDNVVLSDGEKRPTSTTLFDCVDVRLEHVRQPKLDVEVVAPSVVPGQYRRGVYQFTVTNRTPAGDTLQGTVSENTIVHVIRDGQLFAIANFDTLQPGESQTRFYAINLDGQDVGDSVTVEFEVFNDNGLVDGRLTGRHEMVRGPEADFVVDASEDQDSACTLECTESEGECPPRLGLPRCTLSDALEQAAVSSLAGQRRTLLLAPGVVMLDEETAPLTIGSAVDIIGMGPDRSAISGSGRFPLFNVVSPDLRLRDLSLEGGLTNENEDGGTSAVINVAGGAALSLERVAVAGHVGQTLLRNNGELNMSQVSLEGNVMERYLVELQGGRLTMVNAIVQDNDLAEADSLGLIGNLFGVALLEHVTAAGNSAPLLYSQEGAGPSTIRNSALDGNGEPVCRVVGGLAPRLSGVNAFSPGAACGRADIVLAPEHFSDARDAGGYTTLLPAADGLLVDAIEPDQCPGIDAFGLVRALDSDGDGTPRCDVGAVERLPGSLLSSVTFDEDAPGDGFYLIADGKNLSAAFFGYDSSSEPMWLVGTASLADQRPTLGGGLVFDMLESGPEGSFGRPQNPGSDPLEPWGQITFRFDDCNAGTAVLDGVHGTKVMTLDSLVTQGSCRQGPTGGAAENLESPNLSAVFYDEAAAGDGFYLVDNGSAVSVAFFGYDDDGEPLWLVGATERDDSEPVAGSTLTFDLVNSGSEGRFEEPQNPGSQPLEDWGTLEVTFASCQRADAVLSGNDGEKRMSLTALVATGTCED
ncbi:MAG: Ig-like domain-containing protein [Pseudomonadota bacterium]